jgi:hypothetical protein
MYQTEIPTRHRVGDRRKELRMPVVVGIKVVMSFSWYRRSPPTAHVDGLSLSAGLVSVHALVRRNQNIRHRLG